MGTPQLQARVLAIVLTLAAAIAGTPALSQTQTRAFVAPPRSIADITAILDQEKPDPAKRAKAEAEADQQPPANLKGQALSDFLYKRAQARSSIGRIKDAIADAEKAISLGGDYKDYVSRIEQFLEQQYAQSGDIKSAIELLQRMVGRLNVKGSKGRLFQIYNRLSINHLQLGDVNTAEGYLRRAQALYAESAQWDNVEPFRSSWEASIEHGRARVLETRGRYREAEQSFQRSARLTLDAANRSRSWPSAPPPQFFAFAYDFAMALTGRVKAKQGRVAEAEVDMRRALLSRLKAVGKYNQETASMITLFSNLLLEQARFAESEKLARVAVEIYETLGFPKDAQQLVQARMQLAATLFSQGRFADAKEVYQIIDSSIEGWDEKRSARFRLSWSRIFVSYYTREVPKGIELAREYVAKEKARVGDKHFDSAMARAIYAAGLAFARRDAEALQEFKAAMPIILAAAGEVTDDDDTSKQAADTRLQNVMETYIALLARTQEGGAAGIESFQLGEAIRGRSVQNALAASGARASAKTPALAEIVRKEQDLEKQIAAQTGAVNNMLSLAPEERDDKELQSLQTDLDKLRVERRTIRRDIERKFPEYAALVTPRPLTIADIQEALKEDEAFVSFYFGRRNSFAWAVPKSGQVAFAQIIATGKEIDEKVAKLREALAPNASTIEEIPPFNLELAHELYRTLLEPIRSGWKPAKSLIVVTNGSLGTLPLSLLVVDPATLANEEPVFAGYRKVAWLARTHAVTAVPSAASLRTLRRLPVTVGKRDGLIGFGDPFFNADQVNEKAEIELSDADTVTTRGIPIRLRAAPKTRGVDSAEIAMLPRLPDTADELKSIAAALEADPSKVLHLGKDANEKTVKSLDLSRYRIVAFATHGLIPGELDGLTQPALALSAPNVADVDGDGLLTMEEILGLKLNADWVVLSACNTGAAAAEGAEAASGLGRAFFYAGTRAILVTNWSVHSTSARELVTDLFRRQSKDAKLTRAEALRQAMMELLDQGSWKNASGTPIFTYAHPIFWAPYTIIGDGGAS